MVQDASSRNMWAFMTSQTVEMKTANCDSTLFQPILAMNRRIRPTELLHGRQISNYGGAIVKRGHTANIGRTRELLPRIKTRGQSIHNAKLWKNLDTDLHKGGPDSSEQKSGSTFCNLRQDKISISTKMNYLPCRCCDDTTGFADIDHISEASSKLFNKGKVTSRYSYWTTTSHMSNCKQQKALDIVEACYWCIKLTTFLGYHYSSPIGIPGLPPLEPAVFPSHWNTGLSPLSLPHR